LRLGGAEVKIGYLELIDNSIGPRGGLALGIALSRGNNLSLLTLKLDCNTTFGAGGVQNLCNGLRTNISLKQLHMMFCGITHEAGIYLADLLANNKSGLEVLNIAGNRLGGAGLAALCKGLLVNTKCTSLSLADNMIDYQTPEGIEGLNELKECIMAPTLVLASLDLQYNRLGKCHCCLPCHAFYNVIPTRCASFFFCRRGGRCQHTYTSDGREHQNQGMSR
jgi:Leucine Rich repeat